MLSEIQNSIKAKLYDFTYTPFLSSVIIAWIVLNHKYLLIYFGNSKTSEKIALLEKYDFSCHIPKIDITVPYCMNVVLPILFGLFYVFIYPLLAKVFYQYTLNRTKQLKEIKQKIEDETPLTREEARHIIKEYKKLQKVNEECEEKYLELQQTQKADEIKDDASVIDSGFFDDGTDNDTEDDRTKILRFLYESNYKPTWRSQALDSIVIKTKVPRPKAETIIDNLVAEGIIKEEQNAYRTISITSKGNSTLIEMFDDEHSKETK